MTLQDTVPGTEPARQPHGAQPHGAEPYGAHQGQEYFREGIHVTKAYTINRSASDLYAFWRDFSNLPKFMTHLIDVSVKDEKHSHWKVKAPGNQTVEWDAEIINEQPGKLISWRSLAGADVQNAGSVRFIETGDRGTEVHVSLDYIPSGGKLGAIIASLLGENPRQQIQEDLRHFKQLMEAGEIPTSESPRGSCGRDSSKGGRS